MATPSPSPTPILIELVNNDAGSFDWIATLLPFVTLAVGAYATYFFTGRADRLKAKRDNAIRWHDEVRTFVAEAVTSARAIHQESADREGLVSVPDPDDQDEADHLYALSVTRAQEEHDNLLELQGGLSLVAPGTITDALFGVIKASTQLRLASDDQADEYRAKLRPAITVLVDATREYLGIEEVKK
ncbi:hypothetical protein E3T61_13835 [Cryobacterium lactosi]|uniref:Uncharacterized protein n=1 Tax=Cryobacterium lactosi TaxID=1259202 RepID=A0A4R9BNQ6_9MICO|nr:hypothetical protein [Cryobacterium lactosi]TFD86951.1 hypothetical protein E3T61_13835 [Cryobacterium lactosi]